MPGIEIKTLDICLSVLQSLLARGDRETGRLLFNLFLAPPFDLKEMIKRLGELMPEWRRYFAEREFSEVPWSQIIFQDHRVLWQRWLNFKKRLK